MEKRDNKQELDIAILQNNYKSMSDKIDNLQEIVLEGFKELKKELKDNYVSNDKVPPPVKIELTDLLAFCLQLLFLL